MVILDIKNTRHVDIKVTENVYQGDNRISEFEIHLPDTVGDENYDISECTCEMLCYISKTDYIKYDISTASTVQKEDILIDLTERAGSVKIFFIFIRNSVIVGNTNSVSFTVYPSKKLEKDPLTPRDQFDRIINEQRARIAEQDETITEQAETISSQDERITELSGEVTELSAENERLEVLTDTQNDTIQYMIDHPPQPKLYTPPDPIIPESETIVYTPPQNYDGFASFTVDRVTAEGVGFNPEWYKEGKECLGKMGTYNPFPEHSYGGIYYTELGENGYPKKILIKDMLRSASTIPQFFNTSNDAKRELREIVFENCPEFLTAPQSMVQGFNYLIKVILPDSLTSIDMAAFYNCTSLTDINLPDSLTSISYNTFANCTSLTDINLPDSLTSIGQSAFYNCTSLTDINLPASLTSITGNAFYYCTNITNLTLAQGFNCNGLNVSSSTRFTAETIVACLEALADRTGQTAYTITFGGTNLNKLTNEQKAIAISKNWNLA